MYPLTFDEYEHMKIFANKSIDINPLNELKNKFLYANESKSISIDENNVPYGLKIVKLPGHSFDMVGYITKDNSFFIGDALLSEETINKYGISYLWNPNDYISSLQALKNSNVNVFVPSHAMVSSNLDDLINKNIESIIGFKNKIKEICVNEISFEDILKNVFDIFNLRMNSQQYVLIGSTLRSYLSTMVSENIIKIIFNDNKMLYITNEV